MESQKENRPKFRPNHIIYLYKNRWLCNNNTVTLIQNKFFKLAGFVKSNFLLCCASSFVIAAYQLVRFIPQDSRALHNELFDFAVRIQLLYEFLKFNLAYLLCFESFP